VFSCVLQFLPCDDGLIDGIRVEGPPELRAQCAKQNKKLILDISKFAGLVWIFIWSII
jgi:hypothetical protein